MKAKIAVRYCSKTKAGNTKRIAQAIAEAVGVEAVSIADEKELAERVDILFLGGAPYANIMAPELNEYAKKLSEKKVGKVVLFTTSNWSRRTVMALKRILKGNGIDVESEYFYAHMLHINGRIEAAKEFGKRFAENGGVKMIYDYELETGNGSTLKLSEYKGKVILVVNTATGCGFTPQYAPIEQLYRDYHDKGLEILDIPCNQFGAQAPGSDAEIHEYCTLHYNTTFPQMKKSDVNGDAELPLYTYLKSQKGFEGFDDHEFKTVLEKMFSEKDPDWASKSDIKWNFTKFVVDREGNVVARFEPTADMKKVEDCIKSLL